jgi:hypothetical protein
MLKAKLFESLWDKKTKGPKPDIQNRLISPMPEGRDP